MFSIKNMDAIKYINDLKLKYRSEIIDAVITDPPYNISRKNNFTSIGRAGIDFGPWDSGFDQSTWINEIAPLIKKGGSIIIFNDYKNFGEIAQTLECLGFEIKDLLRWIKPNPMPRNTERRYVTDFEFAIWATKPGLKWTFNKPKEKPYLRPEFVHSVVTGGSKRIHPTQKSESLFDEIIKIHTNEGDLILDPFMGSGTTGASSVKLKRSFIGTEIDKKYFDFALDRLSKINLKNIKDEVVLRSPLYYLGDKYKLLPQIIDYFPTRIKTFYDVFAGGATMIANVNAEFFVYNDIDKHLVNINKVIKNNNFNDIETEIRKTIFKYKLLAGNKGDKQTNKENYNRLKFDFNNLNNKDTDEGIYMLITLIVYGFNSQIRFNSNDDYNIPIGKQDLNENRMSVFKKFHSAMKSKEIAFHCLDFNLFFEKIPKNIHKNDFFYFDPPYLISNATYNLIWNEKKEIELLYLLDKLDKMNIKWALSNVLESKGKTNKILEEWILKNNYNVIPLNFNYKNSNYQRSKFSKDREVLITNYVNK